MDECLTEQHPQPELELIDRITKLQIACSEERIRAIVCDEIAAWEKQQVVNCPIRWLPNMEVK